MNEIVEELAVEDPNAVVEDDVKEVVVRKMRLQMTKPRHLDGGICVTRGFVGLIEEKRARYLIGMGDAVQVDKTVPLSPLPAAYTTMGPQGGEDSRNDIQELASVLKEALTRPEPPATSVMPPEEVARIGDEDTILDSDGKTPAQRLAKAKSEKEAKKAAIDLKKEKEASAKRAEAIEAEREAAIEEAFKKAETKTATDKKGK